MKDILKDSIKSHYENKDYTEVVRDALLCLTMEVRKKSDLVDSDGVDLINKAFSESKPLIKINKLETTTDKNKHHGIMDLSKGLIEYFRNPMSHSKQDYPKEIADAILVLLDKVILEEIIGSKSINSIDDWYLEITNDLFPNTERYAKNLVDAIPKNKYFELSIMLYNNRNEITKKKDKIIDELVSKLSKQEFKDYCEVIEKDLFGYISENNIISSLRFISTNIFNNFSSLMKLKLEDMVLEDVKNFDMYYGDSEYDIERKNGYLLENSSHILESFSNYKDILNAIAQKIADDRNMEPSQDYLFENYFESIVNTVSINYDLIDKIYDRLRYSNEPIWYGTVKKILKKISQDNEWYINLAKAFKLEVPEEDPFKGFDI